MQSHWQKAVSDSRLITLPEVYLKLQQLMVDDDFSLNEIAEIISIDPAISARLLRMVNSSYFGLADNIDTVNRAINYLGARQVHDLVLSTSIAQSFSELENLHFNQHRFWQKSIYCAIAARELSLHAQLKDSDRQFICGVLHDIGHLLMYQSIPQLTFQAFQLAEEKRQPLFESERQLIGFDSTQLAGELLHQWKLPDSLTTIIKNLAEPEKADSLCEETAVVHLAAQLAIDFDQQLPLAENLTSIHSAIIQKLESNGQTLASIDDLVKENLHTVSSLLLPF